MTDSGIYATSDVARDIIQNSDYFTSVGKSVAEYVWNSIDYGKPKMRVEIHVRRSKGRLHARQGTSVRFDGIIVEEHRNGGGLSRDDLRRFFTMHAETLARKQGRRVRGRFGTGKAAAFGIGKTLIIDSVKDGRRNIVRLNVEDLKAGLEKVPVEALLTDRPDASPDGTTVIIDRLKLKRIKIESLRKFLRRSLGLHLRNHDVFVEGLRLDYTVPESVESWSFDSPSEDLSLLGNCVLKLNLAKEELAAEDQGLAVSSSSYPIEIVNLEKGGSWIPRLFGEIDVPLLDSNDAIPAFDNTRSRMNRDNPRVAALLSWIERETAAAVRKLDRETRSRLSERDLARLRETARDLEEVLNEDFSEMMSELETIPPVGGSGPLPTSARLSESGARVLIPDETGETKVVPSIDGSDNILLSTATGKGPVEARPNEGLPVTESPDGQATKAKHTRGGTRKPKGGFKIAYVNEGRDAFRATFVPDRSEIRINLQHPELSVYPSVEDPRFKAFSGEIALSEYAMAAVNLKARYGHPELAESADAAISEVRKTINRLARKFSPLLNRWVSEPTSP